MMKRIESTMQGRSAQGGSALVASLIAVMAMAVLCASILQFSGHVTREQSSSMDDMRALYVAEAGLAEAFSGVLAGKDGNIASADVPARFGTGVYWVEATDLGLGKIALESTGLCGTGRRSLQMVVEIVEPSIPALGAFGDESVSMGPGSTIDFYDSSTGPYDPNQVVQGSLAQVGSNGPIQVQESASILGDATPGQGFTTDLSAGSSVTGSTAPAEEFLPLPTVEPPEMEIQGDLTVAENGSDTFTGAGYYETLQLESSSTLTLTGPLDLVLHHLDVASGATIVFDSTNGPINLYVVGDVNLAQGSNLSSVDQDPTQVLVALLGNNVDPQMETIDKAPADDVDDALPIGPIGPVDLGDLGNMGNGGQGGQLVLVGDDDDDGDGDKDGDDADTPDLLDPLQIVDDLSGNDNWGDWGWTPPPPVSENPKHDISIQSSGQFFGFLYAPNASVTVPDGLHLLGGVASRVLALEPAAHVTLDVEVLGGEVAGGATLKVISWAVEELPDSPIVNKQVDPFSFLNKLGVDPVASADGHNQLAFSITYKDVHGIVRHFEGVEILFDWFAVDQVLTLYREGDPNNDPWPHVDMNAAAPNGQPKMSEGKGFWYSTYATDVGAMEDAGPVQFQ